MNISFEGLAERIVLDQQNSSHPDHIPSDSHYAALKALLPLVDYNPAIVLRYSKTFLALRVMTQCAYLTGAHPETGWTQESIEFGFYIINEPGKEMSFAAYPYVGHYGAEWLYGHTPRYDTLSTLTPPLSVFLPGDRQNKLLTILDPTPCFDALPAALTILPGLSDAQKAAVRVIQLPDPSFSSDGKCRVIDICRILGRAAVTLPWPERFDLMRKTGDLADRDPNMTRIQLGLTRKEASC